MGCHFSQLPDAFAYSLRALFYLNLKAKYFLSFSCILCYWAINVRCVVIHSGKSVPSKISISAKYQRNFRGRLQVNVSHVFQAFIVFVFVGIY